MDNKFAEEWLSADTFIFGLSAYQHRRVRELCRLFYRKGRKHKEHKVERRGQDNEKD